ncbi:MAG: type II secretion system protein GspL [Maricaulaceae bacterium]
MSKAATYLALPPDLSGPWVYVDADGASSKTPIRAATDVEKSTLSGRGDITLILAGENVRRYQLDLDGLRGRDLRSAIEFELEDRLGGSLSGERVCQDRKHAGDVAVISDDYASRLATLLAQHNITPSRIVVDYEAVGADHNLQLGSRLIKGGPDGHVLNETWAGLLPETPSFEPTSAERLFELFQTGLNQTDTPCFDLTSGLGLGSGQDFLWTRWAKIAALIGAVLILPLMVDRFAEARAWQQQARADREVSRTLYHKATGKRPNDVASALSRQLKNGATQAGFLEMSAVLFTAISQVEDVEVDTMRYDQRQNLLQLSIRYPSFEAGAALEQAVTNAGGQLTVGGIRERGDSLIGEASLNLSGGRR